MLRAASLGLFALFLVAICAPLIASSEPLLVHDGTSWASPWLVSLFDANVHESGLDRAFNALFVTGTPALLLARKRGARRVVSGALVALFVAWAVLFPTEHPRAQHASAGAIRTIVAHGPHEVDLASARSGISRDHPLGTDSAGRDVLARMVWGARPSLTVGVLSVAIYMLFGTLIGALAGWYGGKLDLVVQRAIEVMMAMPSLFLVLAASAFIEHRSFVHVLILIAAVGWTTPARLVRAELLRLKNLDFVLAARAAGERERTILWREIMPNAIGPLWVTATFGVGSAILVESTLSFLGLGDPTLPSWGQILSAGRATREWALIVAPGLAIFVTVGLINVLGEALRREARS